MNLPPLQFAVYALGAAGFFWGTRLKTRPWVLLPLALPTLAFVGYYLKFFSEPVWLYQIRAIPGSELLAALAGVPAGAFFRKTPRLARWVIPLILFLLLFAPYLKFWLLPLNRSLLKETWKDGVCLQSTPSTCGPASAATLCKFLGVDLTERELATESFSTATGTENWYLVRALRRYGLTATWVKTPPDPHALIYPAIAGTQLGGAGGAGHFIVVLNKTPDGYLIADPVYGKPVLRSGEISGGRYRFTGFFLKLAR
jgi:hypothetical protein